MGVAPQPRVTVVGSYAVGMTLRTDRFPVAGETRHGSDFDMGPGGKGSNQAIQAARLGADTELVTDANLSLGSPPRFAGIDRGWPSHRSNHLKRGNQGVGGNILFLDGHVAWRDITEMKVRFQPGHDEWF